MTDKIIIPMTGRQPVRIDPDEWPVVMEIEKDGADIVTRQHADGRSIIRMRWSEHTAACFLADLPGYGQVCWLIKDAADALVERMGRGGDIPGTILNLADDAMAALPPEDI